MSLSTRSSTNNLFVVPKTHKFSSDHNFFVRAPRAAIELIRQLIISFEMPLWTFKSALKNYLRFKSKPTFNIDHSRSYFVKFFLYNLSVLSYCFFVFTYYPLYRNELFYYYYYYYYYIKGHF